MPMIKASPQGEAVRKADWWGAVEKQATHTKPFEFLNNCLWYSLPLGGKVDKAELWTNEWRSPVLVVWIFRKKFLKIKGRSPFLVVWIFWKKFQTIKGRNLFSNSNFQTKGRNLVFVYKAPPRRGGGGIARFQKFKKICLPSCCKESRQKFYLCSFKPPSGGQNPGKNRAKPGQNPGKTKTLRISAVGFGQ